jgi:FkbM family methyltransferase
LIAFVSGRIFSNVTYTIRHGLASGMRRKGGLGFLPIHVDDTAETRFFRSLDLAGKTVYDIGGFEGVLTLFFASKAREVVTFEPNPRNYQRCVENVRLNNLANVRVLNRGVSSAAGELEMIYDPLMPGAASANNEIGRQIKSSVKTSQTLRIPVATLDADIESLDLPTPEFIKIDIEGMELHALQGMSGTLAAYHPRLFIELHGAEMADKIENATAVIKLLEQQGYSIYDVENAAYITSAEVQTPPPSHLFCTMPRDGRD